jgi:hypothetical protein
MPFVEIEGVEYLEEEGIVEVVLMPPFELLDMD